MICGRVGAYLQALPLQGLLRVNFILPAAGEFNGIFSLDHDN
jgi:hypothetical protein